MDIVEFFRDILIAVNIKVSVLAAGVMGSVTYQVLRPPIKWYLSFGAVIAATMFTVSVTPAVASYFRLDASGEHALVFLLGMVALNLIELLIRGSEKARDNPGQFIKVVKKELKK